MTATEPKNRPATLRVGALLFPGLTLLDLVGPLEVFHRIPGAEITLVGTPFRHGEEGGPVRAEGGVTLMADEPLTTGRSFDLLFVPGGPGQRELMEDGEVLAFLVAKARQARFVAAVCTGSLVLAAAGLLAGRRATTHWLSLDLLELLGARPVARRVVVDGKWITGAGVSAGLDLALTLTAALGPELGGGEERAREIQLLIEYDPEPPFTSGSPRTADRALVARVREARQELQEARREQAERIARQPRLSGRAPHREEVADGRR